MVADRFQTSELQLDDVELEVLTIPVSVILDNYKKQKPAARKAAKEAFTHLARRMARIGPEGKPAPCNQPLMNELIRDFNRVAYDVLVTNQPLHPQHPRDATLVFVLHAANIWPVYGRKVTRPHLGRIILASDENNQPVVPHPDLNIPLKLTPEIIDSLRGAAGERIRRAFVLGAKIIKTGRNHKKHQRRRLEAVYVREQLNELKCTLN